MGNLFGNCQKGVSKQPSVISPEVWLLHVFIIGIRCEIQTFKIGLLSLWPFWFYSKRNE